MGHAHVSVRIHCVFATHERRTLISDHLQSRLWNYLVATAKHIGLEPMAVGGTADHVHLLFALPSNIALSTAVQKLKANSSRWLKEAGVPLFSWQEGYGAFSVSVSAAEATIAYIRNQREHHKRADFQEEWKRVLQKHGMRLE